MRVFDVVRTVMHGGTPDRVKSWLEEGEAPAIELMHKGCWNELEQRVAQESAPKRLRPLVGQAVRSGPPDAYGPETRQLMLHAFTAPRPGHADRARLAAA